MTIAIMQPYFFPYIGYWQLLNEVDTFVIFDDVNFIKKGYINRNSILINSEAQHFTLELLGASQNKYINEIEVGENRHKLLKTIERAYKNAPQYTTVLPLLEAILKAPEKNLSKFLGYVLTHIAKFLEIETKFMYSSDIIKNTNLKAQDKIIDIAQRVNTTKYINAIGGKELYNKDTFKEVGIELFFLETELIEYKQFKNDFVPYLSIIDLMMFNSVDEIKKMLNTYKLV